MQRAAVTIEGDQASVLVVNHMGHALWDWVFEVPVMRPLDRAELDYAVSTHGVNKGVVIAALDCAWLVSREAAEEERPRVENALEPKSTSWPPE